MDELRNVLRRNEQFLREFIRLGGNQHLINKAGQLLMDTCSVLESAATPPSQIPLTVGLDMDSLGGGF